MTDVLMDFETANGATDLKKVGAWAYADCPLTEILCLLFSIDNQAPFAWAPDYNEHRALLEELAADDKVRFIRHGDFELAMWMRIMVPHFGFPQKRLASWHDIMASAAMRGLPLAVEKLAPVLGTMPKDKDGNKITLSVSAFTKQGRKQTGMLTPYTPEVRQRVFDYCANDIFGEIEQHGKLGFLPPDERRAFILHQRMNVRGLGIDLAYVKACQKIVVEATTPLERRFRALTGVNSTQRDEVLKWVRGQGVEIPNLQKETITALIGEGIDATEEIDNSAEEDETETLAGELPRNVQQALQIRQLIGSSSTKKLWKMEECLCSDNRARGLSQFHGSLPGRSTGRLWQPYNFPRGTLKEPNGKPPDVQTVVDTLLSGDWEFVHAVLGPPIETVVSGLRHAVVADPGHVFLSGDYAGIQARVVLALAGQWDKVDLMASGADVYCDMAGQIYKRPITKADKIERQVGKNSVLGLGFGMGFKKFWAKYCKSLPLEFAQEVVSVYREEWAPQVPNLWRALQNGSLRALKDSRRVDVRDEDGREVGVSYWPENGCLIARVPTGGQIYYWNPRIVRRAMPWDDSDIRLSWTFQAMKAGRFQTLDTFGGQLTENAVMRIEVDIQRHGWANCERNGFPIYHECYDELVAQVPAANPDLRGFRQCLLDVPRGAIEMKVPIDVPEEDVWAGGRYQK